MTERPFKRLFLKILGRRRRVHRSFEKYILELSATESQPVDPRATVIFAGLSKKKFSRGGKVTALRYLPLFCDLLRKSGFRTKYVTSVHGLSRAIRNAENTVVVMVYREVGYIPEHPKLNDILADAHLVFHHPRIGKILGYKKTANEYLSRHGVPMPEIQSGNLSTKEVFSNHNNDSRADVSLLPENAHLDEERYNTNFVDTRIMIDSELYYSTVRLMCVGEIVTHSYVRARNVRDANPSVHAKDTPIDEHLLNTLHAKIIEPNKKKLIKLAEELSQALGPGFYSHDVLIDSTTKEIYLAEAGFKFDDPSFCNRMSAVISDVPSMTGFTTAEETAINSFPAFLKILNTHFTPAH